MTSPSLPHSSKNASGRTVYQTLRGLEEKALKNPDDTAAWWEIVHTLRRMGRMGIAALVLEHILHLNPLDAHALKLYISLSNITGRAPAYVLHHCETFLNEIDANDPDVLEAAATAAWLDYHTERAHDYWARTAQLRPREIRCRYYAAMSSLKRVRGVSISCWQLDLRRRNV